MEKPPPRVTRTLDPTEVRASSVALGVLAELSRDLAEAGLDLDCALETLARRVAELLGDACEVRLLSDDGEWLELRAFHHVVPAARARLADALPRRAPADAHLTGQVVATGEPLLLPGAPVPEMPAYAALRDCLREHPVESMMLVPLRLDGRVAGTIAMGRGPASGGYSRADLKLLEEIAERAGMALTMARQHARLVDERRRMDAVLAQLPSAVAVVDAATDRLVMANARNEEIFRVPIAGPGGRADFGKFKGLHPSGRLLAPDEWPLARSLRDGTIVRGEEVEIVRGDDVRGVIRINSAPVRDDAGHIVAGVVIYDDVTEERRAVDGVRFLAEAARLLASSLDYETTLQSVARLAVPRLADWCAMEMVEDDGSTRQLAVAHVDPARVALAQEHRRRFPPDPANPNGVLSVIRTGEPRLLPEITDEMLSAGTRDAEHLALVRQLGLCSLMIVPLRTPEQVVGAITFASAESGRRYDTQDLDLCRELANRAALAIGNARLYREAQAADRRKSDFIAVLAHELRNPLAPLRTGLELLASRLVEDPAASAPLAAMRRQLRNMTRLVDDLLDVSRITRGKFELRRERTRLSAVLDRALDTAGGLLETRGHQLVRGVVPPVVVDADPVRLEQVFANLLNNAARYTPPGGRIAVAGRLDGDTVVVSVTDTGVGFSADEQGTLFELFAQTRRDLDGAADGLGIGLTLVKSIVQMHGGEITAHSAGPDRGSTFQVCLPVLSVGYEPTPPPPPATPVATGSLRVLVVDDNTDAAETLQMLLELWGHESYATFDGAAAVEAAAAQRPDVVLLDLGMPGMDGFSVLSALRARPELAATRFYALSGFGQPRDHERTRAAGFDGHLVKPVDPDALRRVLGGS